MAELQLISIIVVTHNTGPVLYRSIASILAQKEKLELVLVNNGNPPDVEAKLIEKFKDVPNVRLMTGHGDIGIVKGRNLGARVATGDYLLFLDDNCLLPENCLTLLHQETQGKDGPYILGARIVDERKKEKKLSRLALLTPLVALVDKLRLANTFPAHRFNLHQDPLPAQTTPVPAVGGAFLFCPKKEYVSHRGFDEKYFSELAAMDFCFRLSQNMGTVYFMPHLVVMQTEAQALVFDQKQEKTRLASYARYFFENFADTFPQPALWALSLLYGAYFAFHIALKRKTEVL